MSPSERFVLKDELIDGSSVVTDYDPAAEQYQTVHTKNGIPTVQRTWTTAELAHHGHGQVLRELTANISNGGS